MQEGVYINDIRLDWATIAVKDNGDLKENPLDPADIPNQIATNLRLGFTAFSINAKFNSVNPQKKELFRAIRDIYLSKKPCTLTTNEDIIENLVILDMDRDLNKYNYSFSLSVKQFQVSKLTSTGNPKKIEKRQVSDTTTVGTQGVTQSNVNGGYLT